VLLVVGSSLAERHTLLTVQEIVEATRRQYLNAITQAQLEGVMVCYSRV